MAGPRLFDRRWRVEVTRETGANRQTTIDVSELDLAFEVRRDLTRKPNKARVEIWNLSEEKRGALAEALATSPRSAQFAPVSMRISAGYEDPGVSLLFSGEVTRLSVAHEQHDVTTTLEGKDARSVLRGARISKSYAPGTTVEAVVRSVVSALGVGEGNLAAYVTGIAIDGDRIFREGYAVTGTAANVLTDLLRPAGLRWSIQAGALEVRQAGRGLDDRVIQLSPSSGLVGAPQPGDKGEIDLTALIQPGLTPGARISVESADMRGLYVIRDTVFKGDTRSRDWYAHIKARPA